MDKDELLAVFDQEQRIDVRWPGMVHEVAGPVVRHYTPAHHTGFIAYSALDEGSVDAEIDRQIAFFDPQGISFEWKVYDHDRPADLRQRLADRGFVIEPPEALMVLDLETAPGVFWTQALPDNLVKVTSPAGVIDLMQMEEAVWQSDHQDLGEGLQTDLREHPDLISIFVIPADGKVVSGAWMYYHPPSQFASLWGGSTLAAYRHHGYYTALLFARAREARQRNYRFLTVDASPMSRPILEKYGFQFLGFSTPCKWKAKADKGSDNGND